MSIIVSSGQTFLSSGVEQPWLLLPHGTHICQANTNPTRPTNAMSRFARVTGDDAIMAMVMVVVRKRGSGKLGMHGGCLASRTVALALKRAAAKSRHHRAVINKLNQDTSMLLLSCSWEELGFFLEGEGVHRVLDVVLCSETQPSVSMAFPVVLIWPRANLQDQIRKV